MIDPNQPAFPVQENNGLTGMSIRLKIAADTMACMISSDISPGHYPEIVRRSLLAADELLKQYNNAQV